jgi:hypothetical protein
LDVQFISFQFISLGIVDYISDDNPEAAQRVKDDIEAKAEKLQDFPRMGRPGRVEGTRELVTLQIISSYTKKRPLPSEYYACCMLRSSAPPS